MNEVEYRDNFNKMEFSFGSEVIAIPGKSLRNLWIVFCGIQMSFSFHHEMITNLILCVATCHNMN